MLRHHAHLLKVCTGNLQRCKPRQPGLDGACTRNLAVFRDPLRSPPPRTVCLPIWRCSGVMSGRLNSSRAVSVCTSRPSVKAAVMVGSWGRGKGTPHGHATLQDTCRNMGESEVHSFCVQGMLRGVTLVQWMQLRKGSERRAGALQHSLAPAGWQGARMGRSICRRLPARSPRPPSSNVRRSTRSHAL